MTAKQVTGLGHPSLLVNSRPIRHESRARPRPAFSQTILSRIRELAAIAPRQGATAMLGDHARTELTIVYARWILAAVLGAVVFFLPIDTLSRVGLIVVLLCAMGYNAVLQGWAIPRWGDRPALGRAAVAADAVFVASTIAVTGGVDSAMWGAVYIHAITVAIRFSIPGGVASALLLSAMCATFVFPGRDPMVVGPDFGLRAALLLTAAIFAGALSHQAHDSYARLREQLRRAQQLRRASAAVTPVLDVARISGTAVREATELVGGSAGVLVRTGDSEPVWFVRPEIDLPTALAFAEMVAGFDDVPSVGVEVRHHGSEQSDGDASALGSVVCARLSGHAGPLGKLLVARASGDRPFDSVDIEALTILSERAGLALDNALLHQQTGDQLAEVELAQAQAIQAGKLAAIGELAANVAHELNNPLTGVLMHLGLLGETEELSPTMQSSVQAMEGEVIRMRGIVHDLLDFARRSESRMAETDMVELLRNSLALISHREEMAGIEVVWDAPAGPRKVNVDANQLKQVFVNLFGNAIDAMGSKGQLSITIRDIADWVCVDVADTGPGIPTNVLDRVFEPFFTTKSGGKGTGLGLSVSHGIVTKHGGNISVSSSPGRGTTFTVQIPSLEPVVARVLERDV